MDFMKRIMKSLQEDDSPYQVNTKLKEFETKWVLQLDAKYNGQRMDSWDELEKKNAESAQNMSMEDENISSFYDFDYDFGGDATTAYLSRAERLNQLLETFKDKKPVFHDRERILANLFPEYVEDEQKKEKHIKHENDYFEAKDSKDLLNFIVRTIKAKKGKKILVITMPGKFEEGTRKTLQAELGKLHTIGSDPEELDEEGTDVVACDINVVAKFYRGYKVPNIIINLDVCYDISAFLNRMLLKRAEEEKFKCTIIHAGSGIVKSLEEHFG